MSSPSTSANAAAQGSRPIRDQGMGHVMISYNWAAQERMLKLRDELKRAGYQVWMDVDNMEGNLDESMAKAVEKASAILMCFSEEYQASPNCKQEAQYAKDQNKLIIPLKYDNYKPSGWLGLMINSILYHDVRSDEAMMTSLPGILKQLSKNNSSLLKQDGEIQSPVKAKHAGDAPHIPSSQSVSPSSSFKDQEISNTDVLYVTKLFSNAALEELCIQLDLDPATDIANAKQGNRQLSKPQARDLIHMWLNRQVQPPKRSHLITIMEDEENDVWKAWVTKLKAKWK